jgi:hypothetical protein
MMEKRGVIDENTPNQKQCQPGGCRGRCQTKRAAHESEESYLPDQLAQRFAPTQPQKQEPRKPQ